jgi:hypothetical protein
MDIRGRQIITGPIPCGHCGKELFGRADKKFCNDTCRNRYHAQSQKRKQWAEPPFVARITRQLLRNRKLLQKSIPYANETTIVTKNDLAEQGFDFRFYTNILETKKGTYYYSYEYGRLQIEPNKLLVVRTSNYDDFTFAS